MFRLSVVDHVRLSFGHVVQSYTAHARTADRLAGRAWQLKIVILTLLGIAAASTVWALVGASRPLQIIGAVAAGLAFAAHAIYVALDLEPRVHAHRAWASRLWIICERYRALLAEIRDGLVDNETLMRRRDALTQQVQAIYEHAPPTDREAYAAAAAEVASAEGTLTDAQIDRFLPASLRKGEAT
ncbi:MAG: SLATT domain-containing protein [Vicinamibacterales bacterium]